MFLFIVVVGFVFTAVTIGEVAVPVSKEQRIIDGRWMTAFQREFEDLLPYTDTAVQVWSFLQYHLLREGADGVVIGTDGWLFTTEELTRSREDRSAADGAIAEIYRVAEVFGGQGAILVVALLPAKARIYHEKLPGYPFPRPNGYTYDDLLEALDRLPSVIVPDLLAAMEKELLNESGDLKETDDTELFLRTDTHWTPRGARIVARTIAEATQTAIQERGIQRQRFSTEIVGVQEYEGDLLRFLPFLDTDAGGGGSVPARALSTERITRFQTDPVGGGGGLFDDPVIPGTLVGTSYSAGDMWNFEGFLKESLSVDIVNVAEEGVGPFKPMQNYLESATITDYPPEIVIWEIPERYLRTYQEY